MALGVINMAKSTLSSELKKEQRFLPCTHLFGSIGEAQRAYECRVHKHPFWQMDLSMGPVAFTAKVEGETVHMPEGTAVFLPTHTSHGFQYPKGAAYASIKFQTSERVPWRALNMRSSPLLRPLERALVNLLPADYRGHSARRTTLDCVLSAVFAECYLSEDDETSSDAMVDRVREFVRLQNGQYVGVEDVATHLGYSTSYVSARFRNDTGQSLKSYLDAERGRVLARLVLFSDLSFSQIALQVGFRDLFAFSRFFKRIHGRGPRAFRRAHP